VVSRSLHFSNRSEKWTSRGPRLRVLSAIPGPARALLVRLWSHKFPICIDNERRSWCSAKLRKLVPFRRFVAVEPVNCGTTPADLHETFYHLSICMANGRYRRANDTVPSWSSAPLRKVPESQIGTCIRRHDRWIILFCGTEVVPRQDRCCTDLWFAGATRTKFVFFSSHL
jgi:hypothetical protein